MPEEFPVAEIYPGDSTGLVRSGTQRSQVNWVQILTGLFVILILVLIVVVNIDRQRKKNALTVSTSNMRSLFYLMVEFDQDFGAFPGDQTAVDELSPYRGDYSNDYFAQLIVGGYTSSEEIFHAKGGGSIDRESDNIINPTSRILEAGECGYALIIGLSTGPIWTSNAPIILAPMGRSGLEFNPEAYDRKAVALRIDGSVKQYALNSDNHASIGGGKTLFDGGAETSWGKSGFDIKRLKHAK